MVPTNFTSLHEVFIKLGLGADWCSLFINISDINYISFKKTYDLVRREVLYNAPIEFGVPMKQVRLIKICLNKTCSKVHIGKCLSDIFPIQNDLKHGNALSALIFHFALVCIVTDMLKVFLGNGSVNTFQHATMEDVSQWMNVIAPC
jgi:hypothetical protein